MQSNRMEEFVIKFLINAGLGIQGAAQCTPQKVIKMQGGVHIMNSVYFDESGMKNEEKESK